MAKTKPADRKKPSAAAGRSSGVTDISPFLMSNPKQMETFMTQGKSKFDKMAGEAGALGRDSMDAFSKSMAIFAKGFESYSRTALALTQSAAEKQAQFIKEAMGCKTLSEFAEVQSRATQSSFDDMMQAATTLSEQGARLFTESSAPINNQMGKHIKKASDSIAA